MGRKKKELTSEDIEEQNLAASHLKELRKTLKWTQEKLAGKLFVDVSTLRRWESGRWAVPSSAASQLEKMTGFIKEYWMGKTEIINRKIYEAYLVEELEFEAEEKEMDERIIRLFEERIGMYSSMFRLCGYDYECLASYTSIWDMYQIIESDPDYTDGIVWHRLTLLKDPNKEYYFTTRKINEIIKRIKDMADLACLRDNQNDTYDGFDGRALDSLRSGNGGNDNAEEK